MLTLILAQPRTGKSQLAVKFGLQHIKEGKRVFVTNFNQTEEQRLKSGFERYDTPQEWWGPDGTEFAPAHPEWQNPLPHGSVWIIDEAQDIFPQRGKDRQLPDFIKLFSKHGHHDLTIYILTQDASQLDVHLRRNTNLTLHMTRPLMMRKANIYTFRGYQEMPNDAWRRSQVWKSAETKTTFKYSKKYQDLYVSASAHESIKLRFPPKLLFLPVLLGLVVWLLYFSYSRLMGGDEVTTPIEAAASLATGAVAPADAASASTNTAGNNKRTLTTEEYLAQWKPRVPGVPNSAPAYDGFEVQDYPRPYCIISGNPTTGDCSCYTQQATYLDIPDDDCRRYVKGGVWDPYRKPSSAPQNEGNTAASADASSTGSVVIPNAVNGSQTFPESPHYVPGDGG
jgi:hypothetical protein